MKRILTAALLTSGLLFAAGAAPAFAEPGYGRGADVSRDAGSRDGGFREGGNRDSGFRDDSRSVEVGHRHDWRHRHWRGPNCYWDRVCFRDRFGVKICKMERVCRPRWY